jgi:hypothetical protein
MSQQYRLTFSDGGVLISNGANMQSAISAAVLDRHLIACKLGTKPCVEVVKAERFSDVEREFSEDMAELTQHNGA